MHFKLRLLVVSLLFWGTGLCIHAKQLNVGIVFDGPSGSTLSFVESVMEELSKVLPDSSKIIFPEHNKIACKFDTDKIKLGLSKLMSDKSVDAVLAMGPVASHLASTLNKYNKPVIATHIYNAKIQKLKKENNISGCKNLAYIDMNIDIGEHIEKFQEIRAFKKLHLLISPYMLKGIPQLSDSLKAQTAKAGVELEILTSNTKAYDLSLKIKDAEAVYVAPLPDLPEEHRCMFLARINELKVPTMAMFGRDMLECGVLCTIATGIDTQKLARRIANNLSRILEGEDPGTFPTDFLPNQRFTINMETCRLIEVFPNFTLMTDADIINEEEQTNRQISITQAIETALAKNLSRIAKKQENIAGEQAIDKTRTALTPRGNLYFKQVAIDKDRADSMLTPAEQSTQIGVNLRQTIISEDTKANIDVQKYFLAAKKDEERALMLDIIQSAAISYLNVLKAKTLKNIQSDNLEVTKANLEIAKQRESVGTAGPAEVYRWEIQLATARQAVVEASAVKKKSEIALNEALLANQDEAFNTLEKDIFSEVFFFDYDKIAPYIDNVKSFKAFNRFLISDSYLFSPELSAINQSLASIARMRRAHRRRLQQRPSLDITGNFTRTFDKHGTGKNKPGIKDVSLPFATLHPAVPGVQDVNMPLSSMFKFPDDNDWSVALSLNFPIFDSALSAASLRESDSLLNSFRAKRDDLMQKLELRTRLALEDARASFISIRLAKTRADFAEKALDVVRNAYSKGAINILDLIDAQNAYRISQEAYANAIFTFLSDFVRLCRSIGTFDFILNQRTNNEYYERIENYFKANNITPAHRIRKGS